MDLEDGSSTIEYMPREGWKAAAPKENNRPPKRPADYCVISHATGDAECTSLDECCDETLTIQKMNMQHGELKQHLF